MLCPLQTFSSTGRGLELTSFVICDVLCKHRAARVRYSCPDALFDGIWKYMGNSLGRFKLPLL